uniref:Acyl-coenzyme A oxidase n=1 Tax=Photinus pyralis TaxID=7054 RepID=A0A1Y1K0L4_PHOPY
MAEYLKDFPSGPLDQYRKRASFDWKKLKLYLYSEEILQYQHNAYQEFLRHPIFYSESYQTRPLDEQRKIAAKQTMILNNMESLSVANAFANSHFPIIKIKLLMHLNPSTAVKNSISFAMFPSVVQSLGTERHNDYLKASLGGDIIGAYCLTEFGHGSNAKSIQTVATYDRDTKEFILNSPCFEAAKCWAGNLGQTATHTVVYAQLITPDGVNHSLHPFLVNVRDPNTYLPYPGVIVGDMGEKIGLNGVDNGFVMFNNYRIPRTQLLNKTADVAEDGTYVARLRDPSKRYGASLGALSVGRVMIVGICAAYASQALTIAIRYAAVRKQFGPEGEEEISILEYQSHQHRLIPYLSVAYVLDLFSNYLGAVQIEFITEAMTGNDNTADLGLELHAISSSGKPLAGWLVRDAVQECREACAGHGYLKASGLGDLRNNNDANCTYEGENHILIQQTSNWLLKFWPAVMKGEKIDFPLKSVNFLTNAQEILRRKFNFNSFEDVMEPKNILDMYQWLVCFLLRASFEKYETLTKVEKLDPFWAKNESQVFYLKNLAIVYIQHFIIQRVYLTVLNAQDANIKNILTKIVSLYGVWTLEKYLTIFYQGGYASDSRLINFIQTAILTLCKDLKDDAVALVDVIAPPDFLIKSVLGQSDGMVYKHLQNAMFETPGAMSRVNWWKDIKSWKSKL